MTISGVWLDDIVLSGAMGGAAAMGTREVGRGRYFIGIRPWVEGDGTGGGRGRGEVVVKSKEARRAEGVGGWRQMPAAAGVGLDAWGGLGGEAADSTSLIGSY